MTDYEFSARVIELTTAIERQFPAFDDTRNEIARAAQVVWNGEAHAQHNGAQGDKESADRVREFLAAVEGLRHATSNLEKQAAITPKEGRINVAAMALHSLGSLVEYGDDPSDAACVRRGRDRLAIELHDSVRGELAAIANEMDGVLQSYPVEKGRRDVHRQEMIRRLFDLFETLRGGANGPAVVFNAKNEATGAFPGFYRRIEPALPERLRVSADRRGEVIGAALKGVLSVRVPA